MEAMRNSWTDDRLDDFARNVDRRFDEVDRCFTEVNQRFDRLEDRMEAGFDKVDRRFAAIEGRFEELHLMVHRTMVRVGLAMIGTLGLGFAGIIVTQLTH